MEVLRTADGSVVYTYKAGECVEEPDFFRWKQLSAYFISRAQEYDRTGDFVLVENLDEAGVLLGYEAMRIAAVSGSDIQLPAIPPPVFGPDLPEFPFPKIPEAIQLPQPAPPPEEHFPVAV